MESFPACPLSDSETIDGDSLFAAARGLAANQKNASRGLGTPPGGFAEGLSRKRACLRCSFPLPRCVGVTPYGYLHSTSVAANVHRSTFAHLPARPSRRITRMTVTCFQTSPPRGVLTPRGQSAPPQLRGRSDLKAGKSIRTLARASEECPARASRRAPTYREYARSRRRQ